MPVRREVGVEHRCADLFREHGAFLFLRGSESRAVYLMEYGLVKVMHESECGKEFVCGFRSTGSILGLFAVSWMRRTRLLLSHCNARWRSATPLVSIVPDLTAADHPAGLSLHRVERTE